MERSIRTLLAWLWLALAWSHCAPVAAQQVDPTQVLLLNVIRKSDKVRIYRRDPDDGGKWLKKASLVVTEKSHPDLLRELRSASAGKPEGLRLENAGWRFDFSRGRAKPYSIASDGQLLNQRGDASVRLPRSWQDRLK